MSIDVFLAIYDFPMFSKPHHNPATSFGFDSATCADLFPWKGRYGNRFQPCYAGLQ